MLAVTFFTLIASTLAIRQKHKQIPIIFDADFGGPIDDTFALSYALKKQCEGVIDIRLISVVGRNTTSRAKLLAKFLEESGYSNEVDIGIGISGECGTFFSINCVGPIWPWMHQFSEWSLNDYPGVIYNNGIDRMIEIIEQYSPQNPIYLVTFGALTNLATIIQQRPDLKPNIKLFTMSGSLFEHTEPFGKFAEFNIADDIPSAQIVYNDRNIHNYFGNTVCVVPWDTGYYFQIKGIQYQRLLSRIKHDKLIKNMLQQYEVFYNNGGNNFDSGRIFHPYNATASMYDLQIVWLAIYVANLDGDESQKTCESVDYMTMEQFNLEVAHDGILIDNNFAHNTWFATKWKESNGLIDIEKDVVDTLVRKKCRRKKRKTHKPCSRSSKYSGSSDRHSYRRILRSNDTSASNGIFSNKMYALLGAISAVMTGVIYIIYWYFCTKSNKSNHDCDELPNGITEGNQSIDLVIEGK